MDYYYKPSSIAENKKTESLWTTTINRVATLAKIKQNLYGGLAIKSKGSPACSLGADII